MTSVVRVRVPPAAPSLRINMQKSTPIVALFENIRSLHNVGSFFRNADGAGIEKIYLTGYTGAPPRIQIEKVSLGAEKNIAWEHNPDPIAQVRELKNTGWKIVGIELTPESKNIWEYEWKDTPTCLVFGNEVEGISAEMLAECDEIVALPMLGQKESLNVSVCTGIVFYEVARNKLQPKTD